jgi:hypothetical protein
MFLGKAQKSNPAYYLCIIRNWFIMVWMVWIQCTFCLGANGLAGLATTAGQPQYPAGMKLGYF